jgi:ABC-type bacteriocin/lantibiotic exporter with double-glycine peptidase domain
MKYTIEITAWAVALIVLKHIISLKTLLILFSVSFFLLLLLAIIHFGRKLISILEKEYVEDSEIDINNIEVFKPTNAYGKEEDID